MTASLYQSGESACPATDAGMCVAADRMVKRSPLRVLGSWNERALHAHDVGRLDGRVQLDVVPAVAAPRVRGVREQVAHAVAGFSRQRLGGHLHPPGLPPEGVEVD